MNVMAPDWRVTQVSRSSIFWTHRKYKNRFHLARGMLRVAFDPIGNMKYREERKTNGQQPVEFQLADRGLEKFF